MSADREVPRLDTSVAHPSRMWDYWLNGKDNFAADREAAEAIMKIVPSLPQMARIARRFLVDVVRRLVIGEGIRQFLDIGSGLPTADNTHEVAQRTAPECRVVYVDNDPVVLSHARSLLTSTPEGRYDCVHADARDPRTILRKAARTLDLTKPVAVLLLGVLHFIPDDEDPYGITATLMDALAPGSFLAVGHSASDIVPEMVAEMTAKYNEHSAVAFIPRPREQVSRFLDGLELLPPGLVPVQHWWEPDPAKAASAAGIAGYSGYSAVGRKPGTARPEPPEPPEPREPPARG